MTLFGEAGDEDAFDEDGIEVAGGIVVAEELVLRDYARGGGHETILALERVPPPTGQKLYRLLIQPLYNSGSSGGLELLW